MSNSVSGAINTRKRTACLLVLSLPCENFGSVLCIVMLVRANYVTLVFLPAHRVHTWAGETKVQVTCHGNWQERRGLQPRNFKNLSFHLTWLLNLLSHSFLIIPTIPCLEAALSSLNGCHDSAGDKRIPAWRPLTTLSVRNSCSADDRK